MRHEVFEVPIKDTPLVYRVEAIARKAGVLQATVTVYRDGEPGHCDRFTLDRAKDRATFAEAAGTDPDDLLIVRETVVGHLDSAAPAPSTPAPQPSPADAPDGAATLAAAEAFMRRYYVLPSEHAFVAAVLWVAHAHALDAAESTPRLSFLSPEPECGKTRALEVIELLVPQPMLAVNATPAALFRAVSDLERRPTILFDEIDTVFGPKAKENEELRGLLNAGHRRSGVAYRCVGEGTQQEVKAFPAYAAVALAGIGDLPDTILSRAIVIAMRRRRPDEQVVPFRRRDAEREGYALRDALAAWCAAHTERLAAIPEMPAGIVDRAADTWEPLLAVADAAGGEWPTRARVAAVALVAERKEKEPSLGVRLLADIRRVFDADGADALPGAALIAKLCELEESPWGSLRGKPLDARGLARRLGKYGIKSKVIRIGTTTPRGYERAAFFDAWERYLPTLPAKDDSPSPPAREAQHPQHSADSASTSQNRVAFDVADTGGVADASATRNPRVQHENGMPAGFVADVADVADLRRKGSGDAASERSGTADGLVRQVQAWLDAGLLAGLHDLRIGPGEMVPDAAAFALRSLTYVTQPGAMGDAARERLARFVAAVAPLLEEVPA